MGDPSQMGYKKVHDLVWLNKESGFYYIFIDGNPWLIHEVSFGEAAECGIKKDTYEFYTAENEKLKARRKKEFQEKQAQSKLDESRLEPAAPGQPVRAEVVRELPALLTKDLVRPIASVDAIVETFNSLQEIKRRVLIEEDFVTIAGKKVMRKSAFRKLKVAFGLDMKLLSEERRDLGDREFEYTAHVQVISPGGTFVEAKSSCTTIEPFGIRQKESTRKLLKDPNRAVQPEMIVFSVRGMAQTRAYNRAISDMVAGGVESAEELGEE